ncbi:enoyl-CoA hydratase/isomerase family protein [Streptomyces sp. NBC_01795]|uniref:enoyl-CoA hydratase/isomerase family protein n=1 Tax=unclassified Streptomyces TaxID=2593676 RepID=UPI002DD94FB6|nr:MULTISPECIES: enoyl-CoA hydratase/isomerase family protein [unclassified Streptomyces]WSA90621.1 enoyl-CoA hydratase/isomerase family protein [Streptomyces sp. NBC_01795]WSS16771.1 enoyl-CoA hydratase/isomerase family protein [Streptomyces sp. NBC_01186]
MDPLIEVDETAQVRSITLNRPDRLNALNGAVLDHLADEIRRVTEETTAVRCLVIRGAGDRAFSAGADLEEIRGLDADQAHAFIRRGHRAMTAIEHSPVPVLAEVDGFALGGGFELMLACHVVIASDRSQFGLPEARIGCIPGFGGTQRLSRAVGKAAAFHLMLTGGRIDAHRAWEIGLLSVPPVPAAELRDEAEATAGQIASGSRTGLANLLEAARQGTSGPSLEHEAALAALSIASADGQEGITSFAERRKPVFTEE